MAKKSDQKAAAALKKLLALPAAASGEQIHVAAERLATALQSLPANGSLGNLPCDYLLGELRQIRSARSAERALYYVRRLQKTTLAPKPAPNSDLDLRRWKQYGDLQTDSWWPIAARGRGGAHSADYWGNFVPQIPEQFMRRFTRRGDWVLDAFAGSGTTLIECLRLGRNGLGVELQAKRVAATQKLLDQEANPHGVTVELRRGDSSKFDFAEALALHGQKQAQLALLHPPYHDIIRFSDAKQDLSNASDTHDFLERLGDVAAGVTAVLEPGRMLALVIGDKYADGEWIPLGFLAMQKLQALGLKLKSVVVKNFDRTAGKRGQEELWRYRALAGGFFVFKHEYIFVMQKPR